MQLQSCADHDPRKLQAIINSLVAIEQDHPSGKGLTQRSCPNNTYLNLLTVFDPFHGHPPPTITDCYVYQARLGT